MRITAYFCFKARLAKVPKTAIMDIMELIYNNFTDEQIERIANAPHFSRYIHRLKTNFIVKSVTVTGVDWFGKRPGFIHVNSELHDSDGNRIPGCAMLRGDGVGILIVLRTPERNYTVLVEQARSPVGDYIWEIPAGTLDHSLDPIDIALAEIREEVDESLEVERSQIMVLFEGYSTPGGLDESITLVQVNLDVTEEYVRKLDQAMTGSDADENIIVHIVPLDDLPKRTKDLKSVLAYMMRK